MCIVYQYASAKKLFHTKSTFGANNSDEICFSTCKSWVPITSFRELLISHFFMCVCESVSTSVIRYFDATRFQRHRNNALKMRVRVVVYFYCIPTTNSHKTYLNKTIDCACEANIGIIVYFKHLHHKSHIPYSNHRRNHRVRLKPFIQWILCVLHTEFDWSILF